MSDRAAISNAVDIELSRDEDSVQSLANLATKEGLITFAGINSSEEAQNEGKNEHLRAFEITYPPRKRQKTDGSGQDEKGRAKPLGQRSLFKPSQAKQKEMYQRVLRLSPSQRRSSGSKRIGAIATGLAGKDESQIVVFDATTATPSDSDVVTRITLDAGTEAADIDIVEADQSEFSMAYCTEYDLYEQTYKYNFGTKRTQKQPKGPRRVCQIPFPDSVENPKSRPKFRSVRFLNSQNVVALVNRADKKGAELHIYHLYPTGPAIKIQEKSLPRHVKQAVSLDVCALDADKKGNQQFVVAVAGQDISIEVFTTNYQPGTDTFSAFRSYLSMKDVHEHQMTKLCFSPFHSPSTALEPSGKDGKPKLHVETSETPAKIPTQYVRLASVSFGNTVVVDTFPLQQLDDSKKNSRYVLSHPSDEKFAKWSLIYISALLVLIGAFLVQSFLGFSSANSSLAKVLPESLRTFLDQPAVALGRSGASDIQSMANSIPKANIPSRLRARLQAHKSHPSDPKQKALVLSPAPAGMGGVTVDVHPDRAAYLEKNKETRRWDELAEEEKVVWKERLIKAGEWVESEGEKVLLGVLFSGYAGLVRDVAGEVVREL